MSHGQPIGTIGNSRFHLFEHQFVSLWNISLDTTTSSFFLQFLLFRFRRCVVFSFRPFEPRITSNISKKSHFYELHLFSFRHLDILIRRVLACSKSRNIIGPFQRSARARQKFEIINNNFSVRLLKVEKIRGKDGFRLNCSTSALDFTSRR